MSTSDIRSYASPDDVALYPMTVEKVEVGLGYHIAADTRLLTLVSADGSRFELQAPVAGQIMDMAAREGMRLTGPTVLIKLRPVEVVTPLKMKEAAPGTKKPAASAPEDPARKPARRGKERRISTIEILLIASVVLVAVALIFGAGGRGAETELTAAAPPSSAQTAGRAGRVTAGAPSTPVANASNGAISPPGYSGTYTAENMQARGLDDSLFGPRPAKTMTGLGMMVVKGPRGSSVCPAVQIATGYAAFSRGCMDPETHALQGLEVYYQQLWNEDEESSGVIVDGVEQPAFNSTEYFYASRIDVESLNFWPEGLSGEASEASIGIAKLTNLYSSAAGYSRLTEGNVPDYLALRASDIRNPPGIDLQEFRCRYWAENNSAKAGRTDPYIFRIDPACKGIAGLSHGAIEIRRDGHNYLAGFYQLSPFGEKDTVYAMSLTETDRKIFSAARERELLAGVRSYPVTTPARPASRVEVQNNCGRPIEINFFDVWRTTHTYFTISPGRTDLDLEFDTKAMYVAIGRGRNQPGAEKLVTRGKTYYAYRSRFSEGSHMIIIPDCR